MTISNDMFDAYGQSVARDDPVATTGDESGAYDPTAYNGQFGCYTDIESGLVYCHNRFYSPAFGRWAAMP